MSHLQDIVAIAIVLLCAIYAARTLLPRAVLARIIGNNVASTKSGSCGGCDGCANDKTKSDGGCH
jgi:hypothetical protein